MYRWKAMNSFLFTIMVLLGIADQINDVACSCNQASNLGRDFVVTFLEIMQPGSVRQIFITPASRKLTRVIILAPEDSVQHRQYTLGPHEFKIINYESIRNPPNTAIHIVASHDISVMGLIGGNCTDAFLALPTNSLGMEYFIASYSIPFRVKRNDRGSEFAIIGTEARTKVTVQLSVGVVFQGTTYASGEIVEVDISRHDVLHFTARNRDLTGTHILSNRPIAVLSGCKCADVPTGMQFCDHMIEQLVPFKFWGSRFLTVPFMGRAAGDVFRVIGGRNNSTVNVCGHLETLSAGEFYEFEKRSNESCVVSSNKPVQLMQYSKGSMADHSGSDPFMMTVPAIEQFHEDILFPNLDLSPDMWHVSTYVNIVFFCDAAEYLLQNVFYVPDEIFQRTSALSKDVDGRRMCAIQLEVDRTHHYFQFDGFDGMMSVVLYGHSNNDIATAFGLPLGLILNDNSCYNFTMDEPVAPDIKVKIPTTSNKPYQSDSDLTIFNSFTPKHDGSSSYNFPSEKDTKRGDYLALTLIICMLSLIAMMLLITYIVILRKRVKTLENAKNVHVNGQIQLPTGADGYIGLDGSQIAHREYMTLNNSEDVWSMAIPRNSSRAVFRGIQPAHSFQQSTHESHLSFGSRRISSQPSLPIQNGHVPVHNSDANDQGSKPRVPDRESGISEMSGHRNMGFKDSSFSNVSTQSLVSFEKQAEVQTETPKPPVRSLRRHHSVADKHITIIPTPEPCNGTERKLHRSASTPAEEGFGIKTKVHYRVPRNLPMTRSMYDKPRLRTRSEGITPYGVDILLPPDEMEVPPSVSLFQESPNFSESSLPLRNDDGYMSMKDTRFSSSRKFQQSKTNDKLKLPYSDRNGNKARDTGTIDSDSMDYTELV